MGILDKLRGTPAPGGTERKQPAKSMVAAAMPLSGPGVRAVARARTASTTDQWQKEAWYYFDVIGEARSPLVWIANAVSQADVYATELDPDTDKPTGPSDDAMASAAARQVLGGPQQRMGLLRLIALCWQVPGEMWIIIRPTGAGKPDQWHVLSGSRLEAKGDTWQYTDPTTLQRVTLTSRDRLIRAWCPHPDDQTKADSAMRPALPVCREIEKASQNIAARLDSRIATNGIAILADELSASGDDFMASLMNAAELGLQNPGQASSQVPVAFNAPGELIANGGAFAHFDLNTAFDGSVVDLRDNGLGRLAKALDMPNDVAEGTQGESNHWTAWQVEESTYKIYIEPLLKTIGDVLSEHWFRPALILMGMAPDRAARFELGWDTTAIVARPDDTENLRDLHDRILISDEYMLTENGVPMDAMPSSEERTRRYLEKVVLGAPTLLADPNVADAVGLDIEVQPVAAGVDAEIGAGGELETPEPEPAPVPNALPGTRGDAPDNEPPEGLTAAAEVLVMQALDRAGGRLLTNQNRGRFKDVPRHELYRQIRPEDAGSLVEIKFADELARSFAVRPGALRVALEMYVTKLLSTGEAYDPDELRWYLR
jgi:hypothetical protein